jgi:16S rRNA (cytidine1402-2'-O)-methyltransferase
LSYEDEVNPLSKATKFEPGVLYLIPLPLGNLKDFTLRGLEALRTLDYIICENRIATRVLMDIIDVDHSGRLIQHNKHQKSQHRIADLLKGGATAGFVSISGTPTIADEGGALVRELQSRGVRVSSLPGACAATAALAMSGAPGAGEGFAFGGQLSVRRAQRVAQLLPSVRASVPSVFYEVPPRLAATLEDLALLVPTRRISVVHEVSRIHEAVHRDTAAKLLQFYNRGAMSKTLEKGWLTMVIDPAPPEEQSGASAASDNPTRLEIAPVGARSIVPPRPASASGAFGTGADLPPASSSIAPIFAEMGEDLETAEAAAAQFSDAVYERATSGLGSGAATSTSPKPMASPHRSAVVDDLNLLKRAAIPPSAVPSKSLNSPAEASSASRAVAATHAPSDWTLVEEAPDAAAATTTSTSASSPDQVDSGNAVDAGAAAAVVSVGQEKSKRQALRELKREARAQRLRLRLARMRLEETIRKTHRMDEPPQKFSPF